MSQGWTLAPLNRVWSFGFHCEQLMTLLHIMPPSMYSCLEDMSKAWADIISNTAMESLKMNYGCWHDADDVHATVLDQSLLVCRLTLTYDAVTQMRSSVTSNSLMAEMLNMSPAELDHRLASFALPIPFCPIDFFCLLLHQLLRELTVPGVWRVKYLRLMPAHRGHEGGRLVSWCSFSEVNRDGHVVQVRSQAESLPDPATAPDLSDAHHRRCAT